MKLLLNEPVMAGAIALVAATVTLLVAFGVHVTAPQREAIEGWVGTVLALSLVVRSRVTPQAKQPAPTPTPVDPYTGQPK
jgi:hypothetical protein